MIKNIVTSVVSSALVAILVVVSVLSFAPHSGALGGSIETILTKFGKGIQVGAYGSPVSQINFKACNLIGTDASQAASSTKAYDCAVAGLTSSSIVFAQLATSTPVNTTNIGWVIIGAKASTTANYATVLLSNLTGAAAVPSVTSVGSSTKIFGFNLP